MLKDKVYTKEELLENAEAFRSEKGFTKTDMNIDWMDNYVAKIHPEDIEEWIKICMAIPLKKRKIGKDNKNAKDIKAIRKAFLSKYFPEQTDEAKEKKKEEERRIKEEEKNRKEEEAKLTPEERMRKKMAELAKK